MYRLFPLIALSSCTLSGGLGLHHSELDSEFQEGDLLGFVQGELPVNDNISFYVRHESIPFKSDRNEKGSGGINSLGILGKIKLY